MRRNRWIWVSFSIALVLLLGTLATSYTEAQGQAEMNKQAIDITVNLDRGNAREIVWTSDLSEDYVRINASYRS